jgi:hypothetical protein
VKLFVPLWFPRNFNTDPALAALPVRVSEETSPVEVLVFFYHVLETYPKDRIIPELVAEFLFDILVPLL